MGSAAIKQAIGAASAYLSEHPADALSTDSAATATIVDGLVTRVTGPNGESLTTDMVPSVGGGASAPSPGWLLRAAGASCVATLIAMRAAMLDITLDTLEVTVDSVSDDRGLLGIADSVPAAPLSRPNRDPPHGSGSRTGDPRGDCPLGRRPLSRQRRARAGGAGGHRGRDRLIGVRPAGRPARFD